MGTYVVQDGNALMHSGLLSGTDVVYWLGKMGAKGGVYVVVKWVAGEWNQGWQKYSIEGDGWEEGCIGQQKYGWWSMA